MKIRGLMVLILILILVAPTLSLFQSGPPDNYQTGVSGRSVVIIAKEDFMYARVLITIQPDFGIGQNPVTVTFPNGTSVAITDSQTETVVLPNTVYYTFSSVAASGQGFSVSSGHPLDVSLQSGQNATQFLILASSPVPIEGIHVFYMLINGTAEVRLQALGVSL
jgi:hypothetical protein